MAHEIAGAAQNVWWSINEDRMILRCDNDVWIEEIHWYQGYYLEMYSQKCSLYNHGVTYIQIEYE